MSRIQKISRWKRQDYGIYDSLTPQMRQVIDSAIIEFVASRPREGHRDRALHVRAGTCAHPRTTGLVLYGSNCRPNRQRRIDCGQ